MLDFVFVEGFGGEVRVRSRPCLRGWGLVKQQQQQQSLSPPLPTRSPSMPTSSSSTLAGERPSRAGPMAWTARELCVGAILGRWGEKKGSGVGGADWHAGEGDWLAHERRVCECVCVCVLRGELRESVAFECFRKIAGRGRAVYLWLQSGNKKTRGPPSIGVAFPARGALTPRLAPCAAKSIECF
jgi:hypothetical protein